MKKILLLLLIGIISLSGCGIVNQKKDKQGSLSINITQSGVIAKTIEPSLDMNIAAYDIIGTGPYGANFRRDNVSPDGAVTINTLSIGIWSIEVQAKNTDGTIIASGATSTQVTAGSSTTASVTVKPIDGTGVVDITVSWPAGVIANPSVTGILISTNGDAQNISYTLAGDLLSAIYHNGTISTGYYTLITQLKDNSIIKWSAVDAVRIINGQPTTGIYALTAVQGQFGDIQLIINPDLQNPITITFNGKENILPVGTDMMIIANTSEPVDSYQWYLNGSALPGATNSSLTIGRTLGVGSYRLDLVVKKGDILSAGYILFNVRLNKILYSSVQGGNWEIFMMNPDGSNQTRLTNNSVSDIEPSWSPDGSKIIFSSNRNGNQEIYLMNPDGSNQSRLTYTTNNNFSPVWSPDGSKIAFSSNRDGNYKIYLMNNDGSNQTKTTTSTYNSRHPAWSPDGKKIVFDSGTDQNSDIYVINSDGSNRVRLTTHGADRYPCWSPDGRKIAFMAYIFPTWNVYTINPDGSGRTTLIYSDSYCNDNPKYSPDGKKIVFFSDRYYSGGASAYTDVYVANSDGSNQIRLTYGNTHNNYVSW